MTRTAPRPSVRRLGALAAPALLALATLGVAGPAHASTTLSVSVDCTVDGLMPGRPSSEQFDCDAGVGGGTGSYSYAWTGLVNADFWEADVADGWGTCGIGPRSTVKVTVTDSAGDTGSAQESFLCQDL